MPEQKLTWEQIPLKVKEWVNRFFWTFDEGFRLTIANEIMEAVKPELEKAFDSNGQFGNTPDFETWYKNTYLK